MTKPKLLFLTTSFIFSTSLFAQNDFREVGMTLSDNFAMGFVYKKQKTENSYINYEGSFADVNISSFSGGTATSVNLGLFLTFEKREDMADKLQFLHGWAPGFRASHIRVGDNSESTNVTQLTPMLGYRLGFLYNFSESFYLALQGRIGASVSFQLGGDFEDTPTVFHLGFNQNGVSLNLVYRFKKKE